MWDAAPTYVSCRACFWGVVVLFWAVPAVSWAAVVPASSTDWSTGMPDPVGRCGMLHLSLWADVPTSYGRCACLLGCVYSVCYGGPLCPSLCLSPVGDMPAFCGTLCLLWADCYVGRCAYVGGLLVTDPVG